MKNTYLLLLAILFSFIVSAQPVITNVAPNFGDQFVLNQDYFAASPGAFGANVTWDFSDQILDLYTANYTVMLPSEVEESDMFPDATMVLVAELLGFGTLNSFVSFDNNTFTMYGSENGGIGVVYSDPMDHFTYPLSYQNTGTDIYSGLISVAGWEGNTISGTQSYVVDGWGTIMTPYGTFENVLRITITSEETVESFTTTVSNGTETNWYSPDYPIPVMTIITDISTATGVPSDTTMSMSALVSYTPVTVGITDNNLDNTFTIYPNPTSDHIIVKADDLNENSILKIYSATGKLAKEVSFIGDENIDVSDLSPGIYIAVILVDGKRYGQRPFSVVR